MLAVSMRVELGDDDIDGLGHLNQARYHHLLGAARRKLLENVFQTRGHDGSFVVVRTELDHLREVRLDESPVEVRARIRSIGNSSLLIENEIVLSDGAVAARGTARMVAWDRGSRSSRPVSAAERRSYEA